MLTPENEKMVLANIYHEKYGYEKLYSDYYILSKNWNAARHFYHLEKSSLENANLYLHEIDVHNVDSKTSDNINHDAVMWLIDCYYLNFTNYQISFCKACEKGNFAHAYNSIIKMINVRKDICNIITKHDTYFTQEYHTNAALQLKALESNKCCLPAFQSELDYYKSKSNNDLIDILLCFNSAYEYTYNLQKINPFNSQFKIVRNNIYDKLFFLLKKNKKIWISVLHRSNYNINLIEIMKTIDLKRYKKITQKGGNSHMNFIHSKGNVIINNGNDNHTTIAPEFQSSSEINAKQLLLLVDYLKKDSKSPLSYNELTKIISLLESIANDKNALLTGLYSEEGE